MNQLDWGPRDTLVAALHNTVYLYTVGSEPIQLCWYERRIYSAVKWNHAGDQVILGTNHSLMEVRTPASVLLSMLLISRSKDLWEILMFD